MRHELISSLSKAGKNWIVGFGDQSVLFSRHFDVSLVPRYVTKESESKDKDKNKNKNADRVESEGKSKVDKERGTLDDEHLSLTCKRTGKQECHILKEILKSNRRDLYTKRSPTVDEAVIEATLRILKLQKIHIEKEMEHKDGENAYTANDKETVERLINDLSQRLKEREEPDSVPTQDEADAMKVPEEVEKLDLFKGQPIIDVVHSVKMKPGLKWNCGKACEVPELRCLSYDDYEEAQEKLVNTIQAESVAHQGHKKRKRTSRVVDDDPAYKPSSKRRKA